MDCAKIGRLIAELRKQKGLTQQSDAAGSAITMKKSANTIAIGSRR